MNDWEQRVYAELEELDKRVEKLNNFIESSKFFEIPHEDQHLLEAQYLSMRTYRNILNRRIDRFKIEDPNISERKINKSAMYWKERCRIAEEYIHECPCDPDITESQKKAYLKWKQATKTPEQSVWESDD